MNATRATEQGQDSQRQDFKSEEFQSQESHRQIKDLDRRYGKIGISAVAGAVRHGRQQHNVNTYRIPYDRD